MTTEFPYFNWRRGRQATGELKKQVFPRCDSATCPKRNQMIPLYFLRKSGTEFDGRWYCSLACLQRAVGLAVQNLSSRFLFEKPRTHRLPVGLLLVNRGQISHAQLQEALRLQRAGGSGKIGAWLRQLNVVTDDQIVAALAQQWACPVYPLDRNLDVVNWNDVAPFTLFESVRAVPAHLSLDGRILHVAFSDRVDHTLLYALERMLDCRTIGCVARESSVNALLAARATAAERTEISFDSLRDAAGITSAICSYVQRMEAPRLKLERAGAHLWARLYRGQESKDMVFRVLRSTIPNSEQSSNAAKDFSVSADAIQEGVAERPLPL